MKLVHIELVKEMINNRYISVRKHPNAELYIYNYTRLAEINKVWNEATITCRGIICDKDLNVVARPFEKFFNYEELIHGKVEIPKGSFEVYEKLDGSLGILYFIGDIPYIATRGSFESDQAIHATSILHSAYKNSIPHLDKSKTYLFEIIYPSNDTPLVVNYGDIDDIFLLAVIDTDTGVEDNIDNYSSIFKTVKHYPNVENYLQFRKESNGQNREGFVVKFSNGFRMKLKFDEWFKAHAALTQLSNKNILEALIGNKCAELRSQIKAALSEESVIYFDSIVDEYQKMYNSIERKATSEFKDDFASDVEMAGYFNTCSYPSIMFKMYRKADYNSLIWSIIRKRSKGV